MSRIAHLLILGAIAFPTMVIANDKDNKNEIIIDKKDIDQMVNTIVEHGQAKDTPALRKNVTNILINRGVTLKEAERRRLDQNPDVKRRLEEARKEILSTALFADIVKQTPITDAQIKTYYDGWVSKRKGQKELHIQQIVMAKPDDAQKLLAELKKGTDFTTLAKTHSLDPNAKQTGGDMGWANPGEMEAPLANTLKKLSAGQYTQEPFQIGNTWHLFKVEGIRDAKIPELSEVKDQIVQQLQEDMIAKTITELRAKDTIKYK